jgi:hypothetical protein
MQRRRFQFTIRTILLITAVVALACGVFRWQPWLSARDRLYIERAERFDSLDAAREVQAAIQRGDVRLMAVYGDGLYVPGVPTPLPLDQVIVIEGTSDAIESSSHRRFNDAASHYALRYNAILLPRLRQLHPRSNAPAASQPTAP